MNEQVRKIVERLKACLLEAYGQAVRAVLLYGSHARGTASEDSDVDVLVVVDDHLDPWKVRQALGDVLLDIMLETGQLVSVVVVPQGFFERYHSPFLINVRREGIPV